MHRALKVFPALVTALVLGVPERAHCRHDGTYLPTLSRLSSEIAAVPEYGRIGWLEKLLASDSGFRTDITLEVLSMYEPMVLGDVELPSGPTYLIVPPWTFHFDKVARLILKHMDGPSPAIRAVEERFRSALERIASAKDEGGLGQDALSRFISLPVQCTALFSTPVVAVTFTQEWIIYSKGSAMDKAGIDFKAIDTPDMRTRTQAMIVTDRFSEARFRVYVEEALAAGCLKLKPPHGTDSGFRQMSRLPISIFRPNYSRDPG